jgi:protein required for attachment to host cells
VLEERQGGVALREQATFFHSRDDDSVALAGPRPNLVDWARRHGERRTTPHDDGERRFLRRIAAKIEEGAEQHAFDHLILFAPPRALGVLRAALPEPVSRLIVADAPLDVVDEGISAIARRVRRLLQGA